MVAGEAVQAASASGSVAGTVTAAELSGGAADLALFNQLAAAAGVVEKGPMGERVGCRMVVKMARFTQLPWHASGSPTLPLIGSLPPSAAGLSNCC